MRPVNRKLKGTLVFSNSQRATEIWEDIEAGILTHGSISYLVKRKTRPDADGTYRVTEWEPMEFSVVSIPADPQAVIGQAFRENKHQSDESEREVKKMREYFSEKNMVELIDFLITMIGVVSGNLLKL